MPDKLLTVDEVADILCVSASSLGNKSYRKRIGLRVVHIGGAIRFRAQDIDDCINRNTVMEFAETSDADEDQE